ncbi:DUF2917 domain-containing protein [Azohydromonas sp.]|uniref:DUF2917 domain-containing protein n=1 Tax=Azohydromonas sp. TaxID=1872666 RepID=UPI002BAB18A0|nr:DUF2917 domain-containing protein [Azohydromonas sp.]HMM86342.1 DUF2917 domain-containing protein [Azohydromonas sp.]
MQYAHAEYSKSPFESVYFLTEHRDMAFGGNVETDRQMHRTHGKEARTMFTDLQLPARRMARHSLLRLPRPQGRAVVCLSGSLWITVDDDPRDVILAPGDRHVFAPDDGDAIVSALQDSSLLLLDLGGELVPPHRPAARVAP